jgi:hypothetical protein
MRCSDVGRLGRHFRVSDVSGEAGEAVPVIDVKAFSQNKPLYVYIRRSLPSLPQSWGAPLCVPQCAALQIPSAAYLLAVPWYCQRHAGADWFRSPHFLTINFTQGEIKMPETKGPKFQGSPSLIEQAHSRGAGAPDRPAPQELRGVNHET